jgi:hypothetical protein
VLSSVEQEALQRVVQSLGLEGAPPVLFVLEEVERRLTEPADVALRRAQQAKHLLESEIDGLRESLEGLEHAVSGTGKAYRAARQTLELISKDMYDTKRDLERALLRRADVRTGGP